MVQSKEHFEFEETRTIHHILHHRLNHQDATERLRDITSWILRHSSEAFDPFTCWLAEFVRFMIGFVTQEEENWFSAQADKYAQEMNQNRSQLKSFSKDYTRVLRHQEKDQWMFDSRGTVGISVLFDKMERHSPLKFHIMEPSLQPSCMQMTSRGSSLTFTCMISGFHIDLSHLGRSGWDVFKDIPIECRIPKRYTML